MNRSTLAWLAALVAAVLVGLLAISAYQGRSASSETGSPLNPEAQGKP